MKNLILNFVMAFLSITAMISLQSCVDKCRDVNCQNGGTCDDGECDCPTGYSGTNCEIEPCTYVQWTGTLNCEIGYYPVSNTTCCPTGYPYFFGTSCYATCQDADGAANGATVYRYNDGTGGGGGGGGGTAGYNCVSGSCGYVSSGASYGTLSECENDCGISGPSLNDSWLASSGTGITIAGSNGTFYAFSSNWQLFVNDGTVSVGSVKLRNIVQVSATTWNCQVLFLRIVNGSPVEVGWSTDGTLTMSTDGNTLTAYATSPFGGTGSESYYRQ